LQSIATPVLPVVRPLQLVLATLNFYPVQRNSQSNMWRLFCLLSPALWRSSVAAGRLRLGLLAERPDVSPAVRAHISPVVRGVVSPAPGADAQGATENSQIASTSMRPASRNPFFIRARLKTLVCPNIPLRQVVIPSSSGRD
jgi:hypothetical protein